MRGDDDEDEDEGSPELRTREEPVDLPHIAPSWLATMLIVSAVTCVVVLGYYFLR